MIKVGDRVRLTGTNHSGTVVEEMEDAVRVYFHEPANLSGYINWELRRDLAATPIASQDWTPHDRYTAAALTGLLARGNRGSAEQLALWALDQADAMMKWRDVSKEERGGP